MRMIAKFVFSLPATGLFRRQLPPKGVCPVCDVPNEGEPRMYRSHSALLVMSILNNAFGGLHETLHCTTHIATTQGTGKQLLWAQSSCPSVGVSFPNHATPNLSTADAQFQALNEQRIAANVPNVSKPPSVTRKPSLRNPRVAGVKSLR